MKQDYAWALGLLKGTLVAVDECRTSIPELDRDGLAENLRTGVEAFAALKQERDDLLAVLYQPQSVREAVADRILKGENDAE